MELASFITFLSDHSIVFARWYQQHKNRQLTLEQLKHATILGSLKVDKVNLPFLADLVNIEHVHKDG